MSGSAARGVMATERYRPRRQQYFHLDERRVEQRLPDIMRLDLSADYKAVLWIGKKGYEVRKWDSAEKAEEAFEDMVEKMRRGQYTLHMQTGEVQLELTD